MSLECVHLSCVHPHLPFLHPHLPLLQNYPHDFTACPWLHPGERARRRDPRVYNYSSTLCPDVKKVSTQQPFVLACPLASCAQGGPESNRPPAACRPCCPCCPNVLPPAIPENVHVCAGLQDKVCARGLNCPYSHNIFEYYMHFDRYDQCVVLVFQRAAFASSGLSVNSQHPACMASAGSSWRHHRWRHRYALRCALCRVFKGTATASTYCWT